MREGESDIDFLFVEMRAITNLRFTLVSSMACMIGNYSQPDC